jgi:hypothetical protein
MINSQNYDMSQRLFLDNLVEISGLGLDVYCRYIKCIYNALEKYFSATIISDLH